MIGPATWDFLGVLDFSSGEIGYFVARRLDECTMVPFAMTKRKLRLVPSGRAKDEERLWG